MISNDFFSKIDWKPYKKRFPQADFLMYKIAESKLIEFGPMGFTCEAEQINDSITQACFRVDDPSAISNWLIPQPRLNRSKASSSQHQFENSLQWCPNHNGMGSKYITHQTDRFHNRVNKLMNCYCKKNREPGNFDELLAIQKKHLSCLRDFTIQFRGTKYPYGFCN